MTALGKKAEALRRYMRGLNDSLTVEHVDGAPVWTLTKAGLAVRPRDAEEFRTAGAIVPFGDVIDPKGLAACYVLAPSKAEAARTECGAKSITECDRGGFCIDCAPKSLAESMRAGAAHVTWHGAKA